MHKQPTTTPRIGIDLGGTKIEAIIMNGDGQITARTRVPTPKGDYAATLASIAGLVEGLQHEFGLAANLPVGIGTPGAVSFETGLLKNCNSTCLNGQPLREDLEALMQRPVRIANDADCFALSEASDGAAAGAHSVLGVILGTGVGGGLVYEGQLLKGSNAISGEWGHNPLSLLAYQSMPENDLPVLGHPRGCYCGRNDCVETWLAGPAFEQSYLALAGQPLKAIDIAALIDRGDAQATALFHQYCNLLALALSTVINIIDPAVIVLGGGMSNIQRLYELVPHYLPRYVFSDHVNTRIKQAVHGDSSGVRGAAWLW